MDSQRVNSTDTTDTFDLLGVEAARIVHRLARETHSGDARKAGAIEDVLSSIAPEFTDAEQLAAVGGLLIIVGAIISQRRRRPPQLRVMTPCDGDLREGTA